MMRALPAGSRIGRFQVIRVLGKGSMGVVYLASDPRIGRPIALKTFRPEGGPPEFSADEMEDQFLREARLAGRLQHPNIVTVYDVGRAGDLPFIVMEYVPGESLKSLLTAQAPVSVPEALWIVREVAAAIGHAHEKSVLHRDIKPGNILVSRDGPVKVTDFGVGKLLAGVTSGHSRKGLIVGSPAYMSPEQIREERLDFRSDLFSLGVVAYEVLTGSRPFLGDSLAGLAYHILNGEPVDPRAVRPELPAISAGVFRRLLAKSPEERPADAPALVREIERLGTGLQRVEAPSPALAETIERLARRKEKAAADAPTAGELATSPARETRPRARRSALLAGAAAAIALLVAVGWMAFRGAAATRPDAVVTPSGSVTPLEPHARPPSPRLPTPGSANAASPLVGAPRALPTPDPRAFEDAQARHPGIRGVPGSIERVYRTRSAARFAVRPEQTRIWVNGRYVGIADDWDGWGGGDEYPFGRAGLHRVRMELPGHRTLEIAVLVTPDANRDTVKIEDRLERRTDASYPRVGRLDARTRGVLELDVDPRESLLSADGRRLGRASSYGPEKPLRLPGPAVHDLQVSAANHRSRVVRVLVSPNAGSDSARVKVRLKPS